MERPVAITLTKPLLPSILNVSTSRFDTLPPTGNKVPSKSAATIFIGPLIIKSKVGIVWEKAGQPTSIKEVKGEILEDILKLEKLKNGLRMSICS